MRLVALALNKKAEVTYCNRHFLDITGWRREDVIGCNFIDRFVPRTERVSASAFMEALFLEAPHTRYRQNAILTRSNDLVVVRWNNTVVHDAAGGVVGIATIGEDITERQLLGREVLSGGARVRQYFAAELHDGLGQTLHSASELARSLEAALVQAASPSAGDAAEVADAVKECLDTCRQIAQGLSPLALYKGGIVEALRTLVHNRSKKAVQARLHVVESAPLIVSSQTLDHLYRLAQEAFVNALRHSAASDISISLEIDAAHIVLKVSDDGVGVPQGKGTPGLGMFLMHYRADIIGATLSVSANAPTGTLVVCDCPQTSAADAPATLFRS